MNSSESMTTLLILILAVLLPTLFFILMKLRQANKRAVTLEAEKSVLKNDLTVASISIEKHSNDYQRLLPFAGIADIDAETKRIVDSAQIEVTEARKQVEELLAEAKSRASSVLAEANQKAIEISGDALELKENARRYERIAQAMKNKVDGYGNEYIIPSVNLLDDLAETYGFTDAGDQLKAAREKSRQMVRDRRAGDCNYVDPSRKETAVDFVVDAFNGKVDSVLSRTKSDNFGKLRQQVLDAATLVNFNGKAFRDARVSEEFVNARLEELKWGVTAQELKLRDLEEQRRIREQIKEEDRAKKELDKAIKDAEKEEEVIKKTIEKVLRETEKASEEQKKLYQTQLDELSKKLKEAEEKSQRAISMAQQTKAGHVYIISNIGSFGEDVVKIGMTRRLEPLDRVKELGDASVPFPFDVHAMIYSEDAPALEKNLHSHFVVKQVNKVNPRKEFFKVELKEVRREIESLAIKTSWTIKAEAREYRESLAIDQTLKTSSSSSKAWMDQQSSVIGQFDSEESDSSENDNLSIRKDRKKRVA